jgi:pyruvate dehydrogenase (quinone)
VPPLPPHLTLAQAKAFAQSMLHGDPDRRNVVIDAARQVMASLRPKT